MALNPPLSTQQQTSASPIRLRLPRLFRKRIPAYIVLSAVLLSGLVVAILGAEIIAPYEPNAMALANRLDPPLGLPGSTPAHLLGTDATGRDILSRILYGGQISLQVGVIATALGALIGTTVGIVSGYFRGWLDATAMFLVDVQLSLPFLLLAIAVALVLGTSLSVLIGIAAFATWPAYTRVMRGVVLSLRQREYVVAARSLGAGNIHIMLRHILPGLAAPLLVLVTLNIGRLILLESSLSFLGIGIPPTTPSWGNMINEGREYLSTAWWISVMPGLALLMVTMTIGIIGDWLRDVLDVQS